MRYLKVFCLLFLVTLLVRPAFAAQSDVTRAELNNFDTFLDSHPAIEKDLKKNPALVKDPKYLSTHSDLQTFLTQHPGVQEEINEHPRGFMNRERHFEGNGRDISPAEVKAFDDFLDKNPAIARDLSKHPELVNDPSYLKNHSALQNFLTMNPAIKQDLAEHPRVFMHRERKLDNAEKKAQNQQDRQEDKAERLQERQEDKAERQADKVERQQERQEKLDSKQIQRPVRIR
jgi:hypothetical protein